MDKGARIKIAKTRDDQQRAKIIEEWLRIKSPGASSDGRDLNDEDEKEIDFKKMMKAMDTRKF